MFTVNHCYLLVHRVLLPVVIYLYTEFYYLLLFTCTQSFITCCYLLVHRVLLPGAAILVPLTCVISE